MYGIAFGNPSENKGERYLNVASQKPHPDYLTPVSELYGSQVSKTVHSELILPEGPQIQNSYNKKLKVPIIQKYITMTLQIFQIKQ